VGPTCRRTMPWFCRQNRAGAEPRGVVALTSFLGVEIQTLSGSKHFRSAIRESTYSRFRSVFGSTQHCLGYFRSLHTVSHVIWQSLPITSQNRQPVPILPATWEIFGTPADTLLNLTFALSSLSINRSN
jgi:hypothetical protein